VALDDQGHPVPVPPLVVETAEERRRMAEAKLRRAHRQRGDQAMQALRKPPTEPLPPAWRQPGSAFSVIGHRGAAGLAPENTLPSFQLAVALGADAVEMDVRLSRDGVPVVIHDATVDRTTDGHGEVARLSVAEIQALDARGPFRDHASPTRIPTLDEVLAWASGRTRVVVELKSTEQPELVDQTLARLREYRLLDAALVISFDHRALQQVALQEPRVRTGALYVARAADPVGLADACQASVLCPLGALTDADVVAAAHAHRLGVSVWTVNEPAEIARVLRAGVDALTSDYPDRVRASA
jgi:glycerophosphoryl diester phosphodiesterase